MSIPEEWIKDNDLDYQIQGQKLMNRRLGGFQTYSLLSTLKGLINGGLRLLSMDGRNYLIDAVRRFTLMPDYQLTGHPDLIRSKQYAVLITKYISDNINMPLASLRLPPTTYEVGTHSGMYPMLVPSDSDSNEVNQPLRAVDSPSQKKKKKEKVRDTPPQSPVLRTAPIVSGEDLRGHCINLDINSPTKCEFSMLYIMMNSSRLNARMVLIIRQPEVQNKTWFSRRSLRLNGNVLILRTTSANLIHALRLELKDIVDTDHAKQGIIMENGGICHFESIEAMKNAFTRCRIRLDKAQDASPNEKGRNYQKMSSFLEFLTSFFGGESDLGSITHLETEAGIYLVESMQPPSHVITREYLTGLISKYSVQDTDLFEKYGKTHRDGIVRSTSTDSDMITSFREPPRAISPNFSKN
jgi:hypothetical protein